MSLKAIKAMVNAVASGERPERLLGDARAEIAELEKAAQTLTEAQPWAPVTVSTERWTQMRETIEAIAKEAK